VASNILDSIEFGLLLGHFGVDLLAIHLLLPLTLHPPASLTLLLQQTPSQRDLILPLCVGRQQLDVTLIPHHFLFRLLIGDFWWHLKRIVHSIYIQQLIRL
jgi:hypothetical protein